MTEFMSSTIKDDEDEEESEDVAITGEEDEATEASAKIKKVKLTAFAKVLKCSAELYAELLWHSTESKKVNRHMLTVSDFRRNLASASWGHSEASG